MTSTDIKLEEFYASIALRPPRKNETTITTFERDIYYYSRDVEFTPQTDRVVNYEDHRKAIETAVNIFRKHTQHSIAILILTHRYFKKYRDIAFSDNGDFSKDYSDIIRRIALLLNNTTGTTTFIDIRSKLIGFAEPTLVQINHVTGEVKAIDIPETKNTKNEWAIKFNFGCSPTSSYRVAGMLIPS